MKKKIHILAVSGAILIGGSCSSFAATYDFTVAGGDFADLKTWQTPTLYPSLTELPGPDDYVRLASDSTFYMSQDMTVGEFSFGSKAVLDFASSGNHTLNVVGNAHHAFRAHNGTICGEKSTARAARNFTKSPGKCRCGAVANKEIKCYNKC